MERNERGHGERGQATPLVLAVVAIAVLVALAVGPLVQRANDRARARTAADATALAGAAEGEDAAREVAEANGAELLDWEARGDDVWVRVEVDGVQALAKARRD